MFVNMEAPLASEDVNNMHRVTNREGQHELCKWAWLSAVSLEGERDLSLVSIPVNSCPGKALTAYRKM